MWIKKIIPGYGVQIVEDISSTIAFLHSAKRRQMYGIRSHTNSIDRNNRTEEILRHGYSIDEVNRVITIVKSLRRGEVVNLPEDDLWVVDLLLAVDNKPHADTVHLLNLVNAPWDMYPNTNIHTPPDAECGYW